MKTERGKMVVLLWVYQGVNKGEEKRSHLCEITCWHSKYKQGVNKLSLETKYKLLSIEAVWQKASDMNVVDKKFQVCGRLYNMAPAAAKDSFQRFQRYLLVLCAERIPQDITNSPASRSAAWQAGSYSVWQTHFSCSSAGVISAFVPFSRLYVRAINVWFNALGFLVLPSIYHSIQFFFFEYVSLSFGYFFARNHNQTEESVLAH